jgi:hypothetical protein
MKWLQLAFCANVIFAISLCHRLAKDSQTTAIYGLWGFVFKGHASLAGRESGTNRIAQKA